MDDNAASDELDYTNYIIDLETDVAALRQQLAEAQGRWAEDTRLCKQQLAERDKRIAELGAERDAIAKIRAESMERLALTIGDNGPLFFDVPPEVVRELSRRTDETKRYWQKSLELEKEVAALTEQAQCGAIYVLDVSYSSAAYPENDEVAKALAADCESAGMGFGARDMQFAYANSEGRERAKQRFAEDGRFTIRKTFERQARIDDAAPPASP